LCAAVLAVFAALLAALLAALHAAMLTAARLPAVRAAGDLALHAMRQQLYLPLYLLHLLYLLRC
jgi:hypothetical protein